MAQKIKGDLSVLRTIDSRRSNTDIKSQVISTSYTVLEHDPNLLIVTATASNDVVNLPTPSSLATGIGWSITIINSASSTTSAVIKDSGGSTLATVNAGSSAQFALTNATGNGTWFVFTTDQSSITALPNLTSINGQAVNFSGGTFTVTGNTTVNQNLTTTSSPTFNKVTVTTLTPTADGDLVSKYYADSIAAGFDPKGSVLAATTTNITLSGIPQTIDGVALNNSGLRVLVKDQSNAVNNGIYLTSGDVWPRASDFDGSPSNEVTGGNFVFVEQGTTNSGTAWSVVASGVVSVGVDPINWTQTNVFSVNAGSGLVKNGNIIDINSGDGIQIITDAVAVRVADFAGAGLEDDGSNNLRIASSAAGDGLTLSAGVLNVGAGSGVLVSANAVSVDIAGIAGTGISPTGGVLNLDINELSSGTPALSDYYPIYNGSNNKVVLQTVLDVLNIPYGISATGLITRTAEDTYASRTITAGSGIIVTNGNGVAGNPTINSDIASFAGNGLAVAGNSLDVNVDTTTIEITSDTLRIAATAAGAGLTGGGGSALAVGTGSGVIVSADAVSVDIASLAGNGLAVAGNSLDVNVDTTTIEINADTLRIAATAAGAGLTGGGGSALAVGTGSGVIVSADAVSVDIASLAGDGLTTAGNTINIASGNGGISVGTNSISAVAGSGIVINSNGINRSKYITTINSTTDWTTASNVASYVISGSVHLMGVNATLTCYESIDSNGNGVAHASTDRYQFVFPDTVKVHPVNGDITVSVPNDGTTDGRFFAKFVVE